MGGIYFPEAEVHITAVTLAPLSAKILVPTCRVPLRAITLDCDFGLHETPVSSIL